MLHSIKKLTFRVEDNNARLYFKEDMPIEMTINASKDSCRNNSNDYQEKLYCKERQRKF